jgi:hypothetical protein
MGLVMKLTLSVAILQALSLLSVMTAIRLDERPDNIESTLFSSLMDGTVSAASSHNRSVGTSTDPLASSSWEEVPPNNILLTPVQCKSLWRQFKSETEYTVTQAISAQVILKIYLRIYVCYKHHLVNGMFSFLFFRRLTSEITTGFHRLGRSC